MIRGFDPRQARYGKAREGNVEWRKSLKNGLFGDTAKMKQMVWGWVVIHRSIGGSMGSKEKPNVLSIKEAQEEIRRLREEARKKKADQPKEGQQQKSA